jgi:hypothetical protein
MVIKKDDMFTNLKKLMVGNKNGCSMLFDNIDNKTFVEQF